MFLTIFTILISLNLSLAQEGQDKTDLFVFINAETKDIEVAQRIVNGRSASLGEVPYQVAIKNHVRGARYLTICGGSIVRPSTVVSAAHCFVTNRRSLWSKLTCRRQPLLNLRSFMVVAGNLNNVADYSGADNDGQWRRIKDVKYPWQYRFPDYDIAVVILASPFSFNQYVNSIPYASRGFVDYRGECIASGYGRLSSSALSPNLQIAKLAVLTGGMCDMVHKRIMKKFICTSDRIADVERGDSGGPLVCTGTGDPKETYGLLVGVTSGNRMGSGSFFTRVAEFSRFIDRDKSHFVAIKKQTRGNKYVTICGGSIVRPKTVVSAAHCFVSDRRSLWSLITCKKQRMRRLAPYMVVAGNLNNDANYKGANVDGQWRRIRDVKYPWQYRFPHYDIAVVILASPFSFDPNVKDVPYASRGFVDYRGECIASGYGRLSTTAMSPNLQIAKLAVLTGRICDMAHRQNMRKFICTSDKISDVQSGDSGGPLVCTGTGDPKETYGLLVGVTSGNRRGAGSFFTRVSEFSRYIDRDRSYFVKPLQTLISFCTGIILLNHLIVFV